VTLRSADGWNVIVRDDTTTLSPDPEHSVVCTFDLEGRPIAWSDDGTVYKRSLASEIHGRRQDETGRRRFVVPPEQAPALLARLLERAARVPAAALDDEGMRRLADIARWTPQRLLAEKERFDAAYRPLGILPPDQYLAVVLQATFGCSWNRCTFCSFYSARPFSARPAEEFARHARAVRDLLGRAAGLRRRIFLSDGDALVMSNERLLPLLVVARSLFPGRPVSGFVDVFTGVVKDAAEWSELREGGLSQVQVGIETGHEPLLRWLDKPATIAEVRSLVCDLKSAGLAVAAIVMEGVGGDRFAAGHLDDTRDLIASLPLGPGDIVYLSPFMEQPGSEYARRARVEGVRPCSADAIARQHRIFKEAAVRARPGVRAARYDIREFVY
jgi:radical SAM superfamily enzyme YgiQ (UPF0313 family)